jgi:CelD/BcsL family acetyltransferase involved in cellulose biosynthesis
MALRVSTLTTVDQLRGLEAEWLELLVRTNADLPFLWPQWIVSWWETFRQDRPVIRDSLLFKTVRRESGELVAVVPLMVTERPAIGPTRVRTIGFLGADKYVTEQRAAVVDRSCESEVAAALAADLGSDVSWHWIAWEGLQQESTLAKALGQAMDLRWASHQAANVLQLAPTWEAFRATLKRNIKESLRHCYNSLKRKGLVAELDVAVTPAQIASALEIFFELHATRAGHAGDVAHSNRFADPNARRLLTLACARFAVHGVTRIFTLRIGGVAVASRVAFQLPGCLYLYYSGFDPCWGKYSVATTLVAEAIKYAIASGVPRVHLSMGADTSKSRWGPATPVFHAAVCVQPDLYSRAALGLYSWACAHTGLLSPLRSVLGRRFD